MDAILGMSSTTFEPLSDLIQEEDCNTLVLYLPGFTKEQLKIQLNRSGVLKISGSRPIGDNKLSSFQNDFPVSENTDTNKITARFEDGILYIRQPKAIVPADKDDQKTPVPLQRPAERPPKMGQRHEPSHVKGTGGKPAELAANTDPQHQPSAAQGQSHMQGTTSGSAPLPAPKTTPGADIKHANVPDFTEKSKEKKEEKPTKKEEKTGESEGGKKHKRRSDVDHDEKVGAGRSEGDKYGKISGTNANGVAKVPEYYSKVNAAAMLKMARDKMMKILLFLFAFALGAYVSKLRWVSKEVDN